MSAQFSCIELTCRAYESYRRKHVYTDCIVSVRESLKLSLYHSIVNITLSFTLISDYNLCINLTSNQDNIGGHKISSLNLFDFQALYRDGQVRVIHVERVG